MGGKPVDMDKRSNPIHLFVPKFRVEECLSEIEVTLRKGWTGLGFKTLEFEDAWKAFTGLPQAHFVNSATAALQIALDVAKETYGWLDGDEVVTTPLTFVSTNHVILHSRMAPVFADVDQYLCMDPNSLLERIGPRTRAVVFVGLGGNTGQLAEVARICKERGLLLVLDAAHMAGSLLDGSEPGALADVACYSFQAVKNLPTADSGMVCFRDPMLDKVARKYSWLGINKDTYARTNTGTYAWMYDVEYVGHKYNGNSVMAALGLVALRFLADDNQRRRQIATMYDELLEPLNAVRPVPVAPNCTSSRHLYQVVVEDRTHAIQTLQDHAIFPGVHYRDNTDYVMYAYAKGTCPNAQAYSSRLLSLPMHLHLKDQDVERVTKALKEYERAV